MSQAVRDPLQFADEESLASENSSNLGSAVLLNQAPTAQGTKDKTTDVSTPTAEPIPTPMPTPTAAPIPAPTAAPAPQKTNPLLDSEDTLDDESVGHDPLYPSVTHQPVYPEVAPFADKSSSMRRAYDRSDTMYSQAMMSEDNSEVFSSERRDSDLADYPEGPAISLAESHVHILVSDPMKMVGQSVLPGVQEPYMTYLVTTKCSLSSFMPAQTAVRRRFKDFVALSNLLRNTHRGYFIPRRPEKNPVQGKKMDARFVEYRRRALERFLNVLGVHHVVGKSEIFKTFLTLEGDLRTNPRWQRLYPPQANWVDGATKLLRQIVGQEKTIPHPAEAQQSARKTHDLVRMVKEGLQLYQNRQQGGGQYGGEELQLRSDRTLIEESRKQLNETVKKSETFMRRLKRYFNLHGSLGIILCEMGKYEMEIKLCPGDGIRMVGETCRKVYQQGNKAMDDSKHQLSLFYHYRHFMPAVLEGLGTREGCLLTLQTLENEIMAKRAKVEELQSPSNIPYETRQRRLAGLQSDLDALKAATESAKMEYDRIRLHNQQDMTNFRKQKEREFVDMLEKLTECQVGCWTSAEQMWKRVAMDLGATDQDFAKPTSKK